VSREGNREKETGREGEKEILGRPANDLLGPIQSQPLLLSSSPCLTPLHPLGRKGRETSTGQMAFLSIPSLRR
jgi:hypothetical protein